MKVLPAWGPRFATRCTRGEPQRGQFPKPELPSPVVGDPNGKTLHIGFTPFVLFFRPASEPFKLTAKEATPTTNDPINGITCMISIPELARGAKRTFRTTKVTKLQTIAMIGAVHHGRSLDRSSMGSSSSSINVFRAIINLFPSKCLC